MNEDLEERSNGEDFGSSIVNTEGQRVNKFTSPGIHGR